MQKTIERLIENKEIKEVIAGNDWLNSKVIHNGLEFIDLEFIEELQLLELPILVEVWFKDNTFENYFLND